MSRFIAEIARLIEQALARHRPPAGSILGQLDGAQVAPAASGSPGVVDRDDLVVLSDAVPEPLGSADAGGASAASRADHVHDMPTAADIGAEPDFGLPAASNYVLRVSDVGVRALVNLGTVIADAGTKATPIDADRLVLADSVDSNAAKKFTLTNLKSVLKGYFDTLYAALTHAHAATDVTSGTLADARLSSNVPLKNAANSFSATQTINGTGVNLLLGTATDDGYRLHVVNGVHIVDPKSGGVTLLIESTSSAANPVIACVNDAGVTTNLYTARTGAGNSGNTVLQNVSGNPVEVTPYIQMVEITAPAAGATNSARLFTRDNGSGKTQLCVIFNTGAIQVIATQP